MDIFPTFLKAAGGNAEEYELDGTDILPVVCEGAASPHAEVFWEMGKQTAVRKGKWKLVLNGQLCEGVAPKDEIFLSDMLADPGETVNLSSQHPELVSELTSAAEQWRKGIEDRWNNYWLKCHGRTTDWF
jgi:arylsulfatase A-like enzyme